MLSAKWMSAIVAVLTVYASCCSMLCIGADGVPAIIEACILVVVQCKRSSCDRLHFGMEAKPNTDMAVGLPINNAAASLVLPGDDAPSLKTFSLDSYADDEAQHARYRT